MPGEHTNIPSGPAGHDSQAPTEPRKLSDADSGRDHDEFSRNYIKYLEPVRRELYRIYPHEQMAEDATHDAFIKLLIEIRKNGAAPPKAWLSTVAKNELFSALRKRGRQVSLAPDDEQNVADHRATESTFLEQQTDLDMKSELVRSCARNNSDEQMITRKLEGESIQEIANGMGITIGSAQSQWRWLMQELKRRSGIASVKGNSNHNGHARSENLAATGGSSPLVTPATKEGSS